MHVTKPLHDPTAYTAAYAPKNVSEIRQSDTGLDRFSREHVDYYTDLETYDMRSSRQSYKSSLVLLIQQILHRILDIVKSLAFFDFRKYQEDHSPNFLKFSTFIGGAILSVISICQVLNIFTLVYSPSFYLFQIYQGVFGSLVMLIEAREWDCLQSVQPLISVWFKFLTIPMGKSLFYIFVGSLNVMFWIRSFVTFIMGLYMVLMGSLCITYHITSYRERDPTVPDHLRHMERVHDVASLQKDLAGYPIMHAKSHYPADDMNQDINDEENEDDEDDDDDESEDEEEQVGAGGYTDKQLAHMQYNHNKGTKPSYHIRDTTTATTDVSMKSSENLYAQRAM